LSLTFATTPITVYSGGSANIIVSVHASGIGRLVCVTSSAVVPHPEPLAGFILEKIMLP
jgi:hypothetical protein